MSLPYNLALSPLQSRLQHIYYGIGQPYTSVDLNPVPESTLSPTGNLDLASTGFYETALVS
jgi:hypothetical protein